MHDGRPKKVLHVLNSAGGGAALSTLGLIDSLGRQGIALVARSATMPARPRSASGCARRSAARYCSRGCTGGTARFACRLWKRPLVEARQIVATGWSLRSAARVAEAAQRWRADLIHTNTILMPEGGLAAQATGPAPRLAPARTAGSGQPFRLPREGKAFGRYMARALFEARGQFGHQRRADSRLAAQTTCWKSCPTASTCTASRHSSEPADGPDRGGHGRQPDQPLEKACPVYRSRRARRSRPADSSGEFTATTLRKAARSPATLTSTSCTHKSPRQGLSDRFAGRVSLPIRPKSCRRSICWCIRPTTSRSAASRSRRWPPGLPVVGVRGGGVAEIVDDERTGLLAEPDNADELAHEIEQLARDQAARLQQFGAGPDQRAEANYSLTACAAEFCEFTNRPCSTAGHAAPGSPRRAPPPCRH